MGDMSMAGLAIAVPFAAPAIAPALTIPGVAIGVTVVVGGYLIYRWLTDDTPQDILFAATVTCGNICWLTNAAAEIAIEVGYDTIAILAAELTKEVQAKLYSAARRYGRRLKNEACCAAFCGVLNRERPGSATWGPGGCFWNCYSNCTGALRSPECPHVLGAGRPCAEEGVIFGLSFCRNV